MFFEISYVPIVLKYSKYFYKKSCLKCLYDTIRIAVNIG